MRNNYNYNFSDLTLYQLEYNIKQNEIKNVKSYPEISKKYYKKNREDKLNYAKSYYYCKKYDNEVYNKKQEIVIIYEPIILFFD
jgi:hypothetical protein